MNARRIKKAGEYFYFFCEDCKTETIHLVIVKVYEIDHVRFTVFCTKCYIEHQNKLLLLKQGLIQEVEDFYGYIWELNNDKWNEFVKHSHK